MKKCLALAMLFVTAALPLQAAANDYPTKPIRMVVPYPPGGATDILGRLIGAKLADMFGQPVVVENRTGASGNVGFGYVARATPDGYTLLVGTANLTIGRAFSDKLPFNVLTDFAPISTIVSSQNLLVVRPSLGVKSVAELIALAKANPGKLTYGSSGVGTPLLSIEIMKNLAGVDIVHVPYKGDAPAIVDLIGGQIDMYASTVVGLAPHHQSGKLRALAVTSRKRAASLPDIPTMEEAGVRGYELSSWYGILAPAGTPRPIVDKLNAAIVKIVAMPDVQKTMLEGGSDPMSTTPDEFAERIRSDTAKFTEVVKKANIKID